MFTLLGSSREPLLAISFGSQHPRSPQHRPFSALRPPAEKVSNHSAHPGWSPPKTMQFPGSFNWIYPNQRTNSSAHHTSPATLVRSWQVPCVTVQRLILLVANSQGQGVPGRSLLWDLSSLTIRWRFLKMGVPLSHPILIVSSKKPSNRRDVGSRC